MKTDNGGQQALLAEHELILQEPEWFRKAIENKPENRFVPFRESQLHYSFWAGPSADAQNIVLLHGDGAHAHWFDFIAPLLTPYYNVIALDMPGMGESGWLDGYSREIMAEAMIEMIRHANFSSKPAFIAHSFGGMVSLITAHHYADELAALMICDFHVKAPDVHHEWYSDIESWRPTRVYKTREDAEARFRLAPEQPCENHFIVEYIGSHSVREVQIGENGLRGPSEEAGWTWKFDPSIYPGFTVGYDLPEIYKSIPLPVAGMFGGASHDFDQISRRDVIAYMRDLRPDAPHYDISGARHHIMLDQPRAFASAVLAQMEFWRASGAFQK
jgi:pimeloyl-ACP methyl ester carboxylesterase